MLVVYDVLAHEIEETAGVRVRRIDRDLRLWSPVDPDFTCIFKPLTEVVGL